MATAKKFVVIPGDVFQLLERRYATQDEAIEAAEESVAVNGQSVHVVQLKATSARKTPPVQTKKFR